jgi:cell division protein FtsB
MATKGVLTCAVDKLEQANLVLRQKLSTLQGKDKENVLKEIARNEAMILDYQFRLKNE